MVVSSGIGGSLGKELFSALPCDFQGFYDGEEGSRKARESAPRRGAGAAEQPPEDRFPRTRVGGDSAPAVAAGLARPGESP